MIINNFDDFCRAMLKCGFSMGGGNSHGIFAVIPYGWEEQENFDTPVKWHTGDPETDPWEWRMRVLEEKKISHIQNYSSKQVVILQKNGIHTFWRSEEMVRVFKKYMRTVKSAKQQK